MRNYLIDIARRGAGLALDPSPRPARAPGSAAEFQDAPEFTETDSIISETQLVPEEPAVESVSVPLSKREPLEKAAGSTAPGKSAAATPLTRVSARATVQMPSGSKASSSASRRESPEPSGDSSSRAARSKPSRARRGKPWAEPITVLPERDNNFPVLESEPTPAQALSPARPPTSGDEALPLKLDERSNRLATSPSRQQMQPVPASSTGLAVSADGPPSMASTAVEVLALAKRDIAASASPEASALVKPQIEPSGTSLLPDLVAPVSEKEDARIDVRIGRIEVHFVQTAAPEVNPSRPRGFNEYALARRYLDRNWY